MNESDLERQQNTQKLGEMLEKESKEVRSEWEKVKEKLIEFDKQFKMLQERIRELEELKSKDLLEPGQLLMLDGYKTLYATYDKNAQKALEKAHELEEEFKFIVRKYGLAGDLTKQ